MLKILTSLRHRNNDARNAGAAFVELAISAPVLVLLAVGIVDYSGLMGTIANMLGSTRAGGQYASAYWLNPTVNAASGTQTQVCTFYGGTCPVTATAVPSCTCVDGTSVTCPAAGAANPCIGQADPRVLMYVTVTATQTSYQSLMSYPGFTNPSPPPVQSVARVQ